LRNDTLHSHDAQAAARIEVDWDGVGTSPGIEIWRVENKRNEQTRAPQFGIHKWPKRHYGEFFTGDSYIVLQTSQQPGSETFLYDIYFWIGSESSQDEYGVAAYKANELDELLGSTPVQHRETEGYESDGFHKCFPTGLRLLKGGIASGFRDVDVDEGNIEIPTRLFHIRRKGNKTNSYLVELSVTSLNQGDAFVLDAGEKVYTWYGQSSSPFEKNKAVEIAHNMVEHRLGHCTLVADVSDDDEKFWEILGGKGAIPEATTYTDDDMPQEHEPKMYIISDENLGKIKVMEVEASRRHLITDDVCLIDLGNLVLVWIGKGSSTREQQQSMSIVQSQLKALGRHKNTQVERVMEGQESRCRSWSKVFTV